MDNLTAIAQSILRDQAQKSGYELDVSQVKVFKSIDRDIDGDGQEESCFVAGIPDVWDTSTCCLLDFDKEKERIIKLVPIADGFRDLQILDINQDGIPEIVVLWQAGSGAYLSLYIFQWDGNNLKSLFPEELFHQGFVEMKDLDADGVDEIVIWQGLWEEGARWNPQRFNIHIFCYQGNIYRLNTTQTSDRRYLPASIVSQNISILGTPPDVEHRFTSVEIYREQLESLIRNCQVNEDFVVNLTEHQSVLWQEGFYEEAISIADLALKATSHLSNSMAKVRLLVLLWRDKGVALSMMGSYPQAVACYLQAISSWAEDVSAYFPAYYHPGLQRELGTMYSAVGDYEHALTSFSTAQTLLKSLDVSVPENREELSRLHSNLGLTYARLGEPELAIVSFEQAIVLDRELENNFGLVINYMGIGNSQRVLKSYEAAIQSYQAALKAMDEVSDRDRESDVYLELGSTLLLTHQLEKSLHYLQKALLLTSLGNLKQREAIHYLYLGEAYRELNQLQLAVQFFQKAIAFTQEFETPETQWQALYGLALTFQLQGQLPACQQALEAAIDTIEQLRSQYLPESLKISLFAEKIKPYSEIILLYRSTDPEKAFQYLESSQSRAFIEQLATTAMSAVAGITPELTERETQLLGELRRLQLRHRETLGQQKYEWGDEVMQIENQLEQLWHEICRLGIRGAEYVALRQGTPLDLAGVKQLLQSL